MTHVEKRQAHSSKETIHSGHFMVSTFEAEAQDEFDDLAVPVPDEEQSVQKVSVVATYRVPVTEESSFNSSKEICKSHQQLSIEVSLTKLFKCMTLAYRQKLTSPKWNRFKGIKLRWKDKIRLNNVIWRCWHMQFIKKQNTLVCQFASPLDVDTHQKPETILLEGKYWKRRAEAVVAEYKKWRMFYITRLLGKGDHVHDQISDMDTMDSQCGDLGVSMLTDEDYLSFMSDTLFSTISSHQPFAFPDPREIARGASLADFIQPSLGPLQPNLDDFMELEPLHDFLSTPRLPPVPEEPTIPSEDPMYRTGMSVDTYPPEYISTSQTSPVAIPTRQMAIHGTSSNTQMLPISNQQNIKNEQLHIYNNNRMYRVQADVQSNMIQSAESMQSYNASYDSTHTEPQSRVYEEKQRAHYMNVPKIITQAESYNKYNSAIPPSQTAPETVSLLQQPVQNTKYTSNIIIQGRSSYNRDKTRSRINHYSSQIQNNQYQNYQMQSSHVAQNYDVNSSARQNSSQMQYLQPKIIDVKPNVGSTSSFKMPSPPLVPVSSQQSSNVITAGSSVPRVKDQQQFRSQSLPLGAQLNADWSVSVPASAPTPTPTNLPAVPTHEVPQAVIHNPRGREPNSAPLRIRSRSTSSSVLLESGGTRRPPPLNTVASEPSLPKASVMLAQLLSHQHSQSAYKLNSEEAASSDPKSPSSRRGQPSPMGSDVMSPHHSLSPPLSPGSPRCDSPRESRRTHMHAEQKRRYNIKNGFDTLQALIPQLSANATAKISKAAMLQKGAEYIKQLKLERNQIKEEMESLRQQIEFLNNSITNCHSLLPATGAPVSRARASRLREMFARHVAHRTMHNWKYWLFSVVAATLVESFSGCVSCSSGADLVRTTLLWAGQHCSLVEMRPAVLNSLRVLCTTTEILTNPERLPEEARMAVASNAAVKTEPT